jgi:hypothetical protein
VSKENTSTNNRVDRLVVSHDLYDSDDDNSDANFEDLMVLRSSSVDDWDDGFSKGNMGMNFPMETAAFSSQSVADELFGNRDNDSNASNNSKKQPPKLNMMAMSRDEDDDPSAYVTSRTARSNMNTTRVAVDQDDDVISSCRPISGRRTSRDPTDSSVPVGTSRQSKLMPSHAAIIPEVEPATFVSVKSTSQKKSTAESVLPVEGTSLQSSPPRHEESFRSSNGNKTAAAAAALGEGVSLSDDELITLLKKPPKSTAVLRTKKDFQEYFRGIGSRRMQALLMAAYADVGDGALQMEKVNKRMELVRDVLS